MRRRAAGFHGVVALLVSMIAGGCADDSDREIDFFVGGAGALDGPSARGDEPSAVSSNDVGSEDGVGPDTGVGDGSAVGSDGSPGLGTGGSPALGTGGSMTIGTGTNLALATGVDLK